MRKREQTLLFDISPEEATDLNLSVQNSPLLSDGVKEMFLFFVEFYGKSSITLHITEE